MPKLPISFSHPRVPSCMETLHYFEQGLIPSFKRFLQSAPLSNEAPK